MLKRETIKEHFRDATKSTIVNLIYDEWKSPDSTERMQRHIVGIPMEKLLAEYGDWEYDGAYTTLLTNEHIEIDVWANATDDRKYSKMFVNNMDTEEIVSRMSASQKDSVFRIL